MWTSAEDPVAKQDSCPETADREVDCKYPTYTDSARCGAQDSFCCKKEDKCLASTDLSKLYLVLYLAQENLTDSDPVIIPYKFVFVFWKYCSSYLTMQTPPKDVCQYVTDFVAFTDNFIRICYIVLRLFHQN